MNVVFVKFNISYSLGGSGPVIWSYFAEFQPKSKRGSMLSFMAAFWTFGNLIVAGMAWLIIPLSELKPSMKFVCFKLNIVIYLNRHWYSYSLLCIQFMANISSDLFRSIVCCGHFTNVPAGKSKISDNER